MEGAALPGLGAAHHLRTSGEKHRNSQVGKVVTFLSFLHLPHSSPPGPPKPMFIEHLPQAPPHAEISFDPPATHGNRMGLITPPWT